MPLARQRIIGYNKNSNYIGNSETDHMYTQSKTPLQATGYQACSAAEQKVSFGHLGIVALAAFAKSAC